MKKVTSSKENNRKSNIKNIICMLCIIILFIFLFPHVYERTRLRLAEYSSEQILQYSGYQIEGNSFIQINETPAITLSGQYEQVESVTINFMEPLEADTNIQIYYAREDEAFEEQNSVWASIPEASASYEVEMPKDNYTTLRVDIQGSFTLSSILISSSETKINYIKFILWGCFVLAFIWFVWKNNFQISHYYDTMASRIYEKGVTIGFKIEQVFLLLAIFFGILFSVLLPPGQVPDEHTHYGMLITEFGFPAYQSEIDEFYNSIDVESVRLGQKKQNLETLQKNFYRKFSREEKNFEGVSIKCIRHLPMGIGFFFGISCGFPILVCFFLAEFCAILFYAIIGYFALKIMPFHKELLCCIMLLPMTIQQCSSVNYDAVLLPLCFLLSALLFQYIYVKEKVRWKELFWVAITTIVIVLIKPPYVLLLFLLFLVPKEKWELKIGKKADIVQFVKQYRWWIVIGGVAVFGLGVYTLRDSFYIKVFTAAILDIPHYFEILFNTIQSKGVFYFETMIANFGWYAAPVPASMNYIVLFAFILFSQAEIKIKGEKPKIGSRSRVIFFMISALIFVLVITIMFSYTFIVNGYDGNVVLEEIQRYMGQIQVIEGVQGRYYIPIALLLMMCLQGVSFIKKETLAVVQIVYYPLVLFWCAGILLDTYYIY